MFFYVVHSSWGLMLSSAEGRTRQSGDLLKMPLCRGDLQPPFSAWDGLDLHCLGDHGPSVCRGFAITRETMPLRLGWPTCTLSQGSQRLHMHGLTKAYAADDAARQVADAFILP